MPDIFAAFFDFIYSTQSFRASFQSLFAGVLLIASFVWGGEPEKACIAVWNIVVWMLILLQGLAGYDIADNGLYLEVEFDSFLCHLIFLTFFSLIALFANRRYTLWIAAWQVLAILGHAIRATDESVAPIIYALLTILPGWMTLLAIAGGLIAHMRREKGRYPDWRWQVKRPTTAQAIS